MTGSQHHHSEYTKVALGEISHQLERPELLAGFLEAAVPSEAGLAEIEAWLEENLVAPELPPEKTRVAMRDLLKAGGFKATGRNKPASEYLAQAWSQGRFPRISPLVDLNNALSLLTGWPMSIFDVDLLSEVAEGRALTLRLGQEGESYVFNEAGHRLELRGLIGLGVDGGPLYGTPVKDSMATKLHSETRRVLVMVLSSTACTTREHFRDILQLYARLLGGAEMHLL